MGWTNQQSNSLTLPPSGGVPRIFLGADDPFATAAGALAAIMFYWDTDEAFMIDVRRVGTTGYLRFTNTDATGITANYLEFAYDENTGSATLTIGFVDRMDVIAEEWTLNSVVQSDGYGYYDYQNSNSAAIGAETVILTLGSETYIPGRAYRIEVRGRVQGSVANTATFRVRFGTTVAGFLFCTLGGVPVTTAGANTAAAVNLERYVQVDGGDPPITSAFVITMAANAGTATMLGAANEPFYVTIRDVGANTDFPEAIFL